VSATYAVGLGEKVGAVSQRLLRVLVDRDNDRLDVLAVVAVARSLLTHLRKRVDKRRAVVLARRGLRKTIRKAWLLSIGFVNESGTSFPIKRWDRKIQAAEGPEMKATR